MEPPFSISPLLSPNYRQRGQGAIEFLLAAGPVLLLGLAGLEAVNWYFVRQGVSLALSQAARAAITQHADPEVLDQAFAQALLPLHAAPTPAASRTRLNKSMQQREQASGLPAWRINIVSPSSASFQDFASRRADLPRFAPPVIDNDYLQEQHQSRLNEGWPRGRGPHSGQTTLEANTLILQLTWLHQPLLPGVRQLLRLLAPPDTRYGSLAMSRAGYLPINRQLAMVMQSHPVEWTMPAHGRLTRSGLLNSGDVINPAPPVSLLPPGAYSPPETAGDPQAPTPSGNATDATHTTDSDGPCTGSGCQTDSDYRDTGPDAGFSDPVDDCPGCCD